MFTLNSKITAIPVINNNTYNNYCHKYSNCMDPIAFGADSV